MRTAQESLDGISAHAQKDRRKLAKPEHFHRVSPTTKSEAPLIA
jgi:hypothetical protein